MGKTQAECSQNAYTSAFLSHWIQILANSSPKFSKKKTKKKDPVFFAFYGRSGEGNITIFFGGPNMQFGPKINIQQLPFAAPWTASGKLLGIFQVCRSKVTRAIPEQNFAIIWFTILPWFHGPTFMSSVQLYWSFKKDICFVHIVHIQSCKFTFQKNVYTMYTDRSTHM